MAKQDPRRGRDAAGVGPYARERERLIPLSDLGGWDVLDGEPDVRSWEVKTLSGKLLGHVREMLVDKTAGEVVMLDVDLSGSDKHAYVPIRVVEIDRAKRIVRADSADLEEHATVADRSRLTHEELSRVRRNVRNGGSASNGERVIERRPIVEETVVRRRKVDDSETRL
jgi:hypothetical protein